MTLSTTSHEAQPNQIEEFDTASGSSTEGALRIHAQPSIWRSELRLGTGGAEAPYSTWRRRPPLGGPRVSLYRFLLAVMAAGALAFAPQVAFAQHGGGGGGHFGGGGHSGGGGGHAGGGHSGGSHGSGPGSGIHYGGSPSGAAVGPGTPPTNFGRGDSSVISRGAPPSSFVRTAGPGFAPGMAAGRVASVPQHVTIGFPPASGADGFDMRGSSSVADGASGWRPIAPIRGGVLSFSGQGRDIWQDNPRGSEVRSGNSNPFLESRPIETQRPHPGPPGRFHPRFFGSGYGYGYGFGGFYPWGFGLGFGFGAVCDPAWDFGCDAYGAPGYGYYGPYAPGLYLGSSGDASEAAPDSSQDYGTYSEQNTAPSDSSEVSASQATVLYLNDGTSFAVTNYWVADYKLHYIVGGARENTIDLDEIDVQRTVDENAARGVNFTIRPAPDPAQP
jgi:hypothetical protein